MRVALDQATASLRDQLDGSAQGNRRQALTAKAADSRRREVVVLGGFLVGFGGGQ